jgi:dolichyl-phosphate beta-glucosyltransferase
VSDFTCGFKAFTREAAKVIFSRQTLDDWSFDAELLYIASRQGVKVKEVPVRWTDAEGTRVRLLRDALRSFLGLFRVRVNALRGLYD